MSHRLQQTDLAGKQAFIVALCFGTSCQLLHWSVFSACLKQSDVLAHQTVLNALVSISGHLVADDSTSEELLWRGQ